MDFKSSLLVISKSIIEGSILILPLFINEPINYLLVIILVLLIGYHFYKYAKDKKPQIQYLLLLIAFFSICFGFSSSLLTYLVWSSIVISKGILMALEIVSLISAAASIIIICLLNTQKKTINN